MFFSISDNSDFPADIYLFKVNTKNTKAMCEICSKLTIKTPKRLYWRFSGVFDALNGFHIFFWCFPVGICLLKVNNSNTRTRCETCSKLKTKTPEQRHYFEYCLAFIISPKSGYKYVNSSLKI